ncbi:hypothetical protein E4U43_004276 [Claviceps pusilla]|uniref:Uncharacterized protein n=1 Tax=Claviceps pusilla TaxID=123648 RepID=A0A9P7NFA6_9HYPO|nr:hypothetical protein E4U43_004276 [Claviceps pusilla]
MSRNQNSSHVHQADDVPPPPYSATDIYSHSPATSFSRLDQAASRLSSASSSSPSGTGGRVIYTPPLTPRTLSSADTYHHRQSPPQQQHGATLYFASRPAPAAEHGPQSDIIIYVINVQGSSVPGDFAYQDHWAARDITRQDWATFVNFLLPGHATRENDGVLQRKLMVEEQLDNVCGEQPTAAAAAAAAATARSTSTRAMEATIQEWNDGFFGLRGMNVVLNNEDSGVGLQQEVDGCATILGGLSVDDGHVDRARLGDNNAPPSRQTGGPESDRAPGQANFDSPPPPGFFLGSFGGGSGWRRAGRGHPSDTGDIHHGPHDDHHERHGHGRRHHRGSCHCAHDGAIPRGRQAHPDEKHQRTSSASSTSTSSSLASSSSASSSIGSLPDYDDIKEHQLPLYAERLRDWASHPHQIRTKHDVKALKAELRATAKSSQPGTTQQTGSVAIVDKRALRKQIRALQAQWKSIKKAQRQMRRAHKRERRLRRRAEKRERRHRDRAMKRAYRDLRKAKPGRGVPGTAGSLFGMPVPVVVPTVGSAPAPTAAPEYMPWSGGRRRGCCGPAPPRRSFFFRPDGPFGLQGPGPARGGRECERGRHLFGARAPSFCNTDRAAGISRDDILGAWPDDTAAPAPAPAPASAPAPSPASAAKYQAAEHLDAEMRKMAIRTASLEAGPEKMGLEKAMDALARNRDRLRLEADEAYARDLAAGKG